MSIPHAQFIDIIKYKGEEYGIDIVVNEESYTSKASSIDRDFIPTFGNEFNGVFSGKRISRGLYKSKYGLEINADSNAAVNILRKSVAHIDNSPMDCYQEWVKGCVVSPVKEKISLN